jgi:Zn-dependent protease
MFDIQSILIRAPGILLGLTIHEYAHGRVALWRGDHTAHDAGRLSFNPFAHLDPLGTAMLLFGPFGWAKPVPINAFNFKNPRTDVALVSVAGPASNIVLAFIIGLILRFVPFGMLGPVNGPLIEMMVYVAYSINIGLSFFNLLPIPPLDGSNILMSFIPKNKIGSYLTIMRYVPMVFLGAILIEWALKIPTISFILNPLYGPYASFFNMLFLGKGF